VYDPKAEVPVYFEVTTAKVNDRKALKKLPMVPGMIYVVDPAYNDYGWYCALDQQGSTFVGRMKTNAVYEVIERVNIAINVLADELFRFKAKKAKKDCPVALRQITFRQVENQKVLVFISNDLTRSAEDIVALHKQR
jgi:putative transposase